MKVLKKQMTLLFILMSFCSTIEASRNLTKTSSQTIVKSNITCDEVLESCAKTVNLQKNAINDQEKVIKSQDELLKENKSEIERLHSKEDYGFWATIGSNAIWLLILLL